MKKLEYSPDASQRLRDIKHDVTLEYGAKDAKRIITNITQALRRLQKYEKSGVSVEDIRRITSQPMW